MALRHIDKFLEFADRKMLSDRLHVLASVGLMKGHACCAELPADIYCRFQVTQFN